MITQYPGLLIRNDYQVYVCNTEQEVDDVLGTFLAKYQKHIMVFEYARGYVIHVPKYVRKETLGKQHKSFSADKWWENKKERTK